MATKKDVHDLFLGHVNSNAVKTRKMMGEYIIYYDGVVIGGLYDNRLLVKATKSARHQFQDNTLVSPYPGAKEMILIPDFAEATNLNDLFELIKNDLKNTS
ncbi:TfoX/Sxy family protein [Staphylococcus aureus]|uniref:TfoX/Sxy family protein n=1 Tax=Staphylococcus aureus TaxID=1280 RepID=UPI0013A68EAB|nr:TfoX/Sxy family protein [Staphylococcus aureus]NDQ09924.1 TfoX/Sxy family protein [Staphylococcus aureus]